MTIDEFKKNIAPYMDEGYVAMDKDCSWWWFNVKPTIDDDGWIVHDSGCNFLIRHSVDIEPVDDWTKSLIEVGEKQ